MHMQCPCPAPTYSSTVYHFIRRVALMHDLLHDTATRWRWGGWRWTREGGVASAHSIACCHHRQGRSSGSCRVRVRPTLPRERGEPCSPRALFALSRCSLVFFFSPLSSMWPNCEPSGVLLCALNHQWIGLIEACVFIRTSIKSDCAGQRTPSKPCLH